MNKYGISEAKSRVGFKAYTVQNVAKGGRQVLHAWLSRSAIFITVISLVASVVTPGQVQAVKDTSNNVNAQNNKIQICHKEGNGSYTQLEINANGANGHENHADDIIPAPQEGCPTPPPVDNSCTTAPSVVEVTPSNTQGWSTADTRPGGSTTFVADATSPAPDGALSLVTNGTNEAKAQYMHATNTPLSQVTNLCYHTKQNDASFVNGAPSFQLAVNLDGTSGFTTFVYEPYNNGETITKGVWQSWDVDAAANMWSSRAVNAGGSCVTVAGAGGAPYYSLTTLKANCPNAVVIGFGVNVGSYNPSYDTEVEYVRFNGTIYDFELDAPKTPIKVTVEKVWKDANGSTLEEGPDNKEDITIVVTDKDDDSVNCNYDDDKIVCDDTISGFSGDTFEVSETGVPAGWKTDASTVGDDIYPVCDESSENEKGALNCTITVINQRIDTPVCSTELVVNGNFEMPNVTANGGQWQLFPSGTEGMKWSVTGGDMEIQDGYSNWDDHTAGGGQFAELDSTNNTTIYQDLATRNGGVYTVTLWTSPRPNDGGGNVSADDNKMTVSMGAMVLDTISEDGTGLSQTVWTKHAYIFTATSTITRLQISGAGTSNGLGGFVDDVSVVEDCVSDVTICKYDNNQTPLAGWEVYLKGEQVDSVVVSGTSGSNVLSDELPAGDYLLEANGTYVYRPGSEGDISDAAFSKRIPSDAGIHPSIYSGDYLPWSRVNDWAVYNGYLGIQVDEANFDWGNEYNSSHEYQGFKNLGLDGQIKFRILDDNYGDNSGNLTVDIYPVVKGVTGQNGCVTIQDVPYGSYKLDEIMQDGWTNVSGQNTSAVVDGVEDTFTLVNRCAKGCESQVKVCKVNDDEGNTPLPGWTVFLKGKLVETVDVNSNNPLGGTTAGSLENGKKYLAVASGEWTNRAGETVDPKFTTMDDWDNHMDAPQGGYPDELLELQVNDGFVEWGPYDSSHAYNYLMTGTGSNAKFRVYDFADQTSADASSGAWFGDNVGTLTVRIYEVYSGVTGNDGCVTLQDVPYGKYELGEIMQDGWINEFGMDEDVIVNSPTEGPENEELNKVVESKGPEFTLVNFCTDTSKCQFPDEDPEPCTVNPVSVMSGSDTDFLALKEGEEPTQLYNAATYGSGTEGPAVAVEPTGFPGAWDGAITDSSVSGAQYVSNSASQPTNPGAAGSNGLVNSWRLFAHTFEIPSGATNISVPSLHFAADNSVTVYLDNATTPLSSSNSFNSITSVSLGALTPGMHVLKFAVKNDAFDQANNPTGVIYKLDQITYDCENGGGEEEPTTDTVEGIVYYDGNSDGNQDEGEAPIAGMTIQAIRASADGEDGDDQLDETIVDSTTSDANGNYSFELEQGCYIIREIPVGYVITEPSSETNHEHYINVLDANCDFDGFDESPSDELLLGLFSIKAANAAAVNTVFEPYINQTLAFGNFDNGQGGNGGSNGGSSSGSSSNNNNNPGQVLGDSTNTPSDPGTVLGAVTELPRTGLPISLLITLVVAMAVVALPKAVEIKQ